MGRFHHRHWPELPARLELLPELLPELLQRWMNLLEDTEADSGQ